MLENYRRYLKEGDRIILKVPQVITAQKIHRGDQYLDNESYLNPKFFIKQFYKPAVKMLGSNLTGFIFEQELPLESLYFMLNKYIGKSLMEGDIEIN